MMPMELLAHSRGLLLIRSLCCKEPKYQTQIRKRKKIIDSNSFRYGWILVLQQCGPEQVLSVSL